MTEGKFRWPFNRPSLSVNAENSNLGPKAKAALRSEGAVFEGGSRRGGPMEGLFASMHGAMGGMRFDSEESAESSDFSAEDGELWCKMCGGTDFEEAGASGPDGVLMVCSHCYGDGDSGSRDSDEWETDEDGDES